MTSCNENPLDSNCVCYPKYGSGSKSRVLDLESGEYVCCGVVTYTGTFDEENGACVGWATGTVNPNRTYTPAGYGPNPTLQTQIRKQAVMAFTFPLPETSRNGYMCPIGHVPRYVKYPNLNSGSNYVSTVACIPYYNGIYVGQNIEPYLQGDFAFYLIDGCDPTSSVCTPTGAVGDAYNIGELDYESPNYKGPTNNTSGNGEAPSTILGLPPWLFWTLFGIFIFLLIVIVALAAYKNTVQELLINTTTSTAPAFNPSVLPPGVPLPPIG